MKTCDLSSEGVHDLVAYRWLYSHNGNHIASKKVTSFFCQQCGDIVHMDEIHSKHNAKVASQIDTSEPHSAPDAQSSLAKQPPHK